MTECRDCEDRKLKAAQQNGVISNQLELIEELCSRINELEGTLRHIRARGRRALAEDCRVESMSAEGLK